MDEALGFQEFEMAAAELAAVFAAADAAQGARNPPEPEPVEQQIDADLEAAAAERECCDRMLSIVLLIALHTMQSTVLYC